MARFDLADFECSVIQPFLPNKPHGVARVNDRLVLNGIFWRILATLKDDDGMTIGRLSRVVLTQQPRVTQVVDQIEKKGLLTRSRSNEDRRRTLVSITGKGRRRIGSLLRSAKANGQFAMRALTHKELDQLKALLRRLVGESWLDDIGPANDK